MKESKKTLQAILEKEKKRRHADGIFGINACKEAIESMLRIDNNYGGNETLYTLLEEYVRRANEDIFFNSAMVLACWELINGIK